MYDNFGRKASEVMKLASKWAFHHHSTTIGTNHVLQGIVEHKDNGAFRILGSLGVDVDQLRIQLRTDEQPPTTCPEKLLWPGEYLREVLTAAETYITRRGCSTIGTGHLLYALSLNPGRTNASVKLRDAGLSSEKIDAAIQKIYPLLKTSTPTKSDEESDLPALDPRLCAYIRAELQRNLLSAELKTFIKTCIGEYAMSQPNDPVPCPQPQPAPEPVKPKQHTCTYYNYNECAAYLKAKYGVDETRIYTGDDGHTTNIWRELIGLHDITQGTFVTLTRDRFDELPQGPVRDFYGRMFDEFAPGEKTLTVFCDW